MKKPFKVLGTTLLAGTVFSSDLTPAFAEEAQVTAPTEDGIVPETPVIDPQPVEDLPPLETEAHYTPFIDVQKTPGYLQAVNFFYWPGVVKGLRENYFGVEEPIKRVDAAMIIGETSFLESKGGTLPFKDLPSRAIPTITKLYSNGVVNGKSATLFGAADSITRGEAAIILYGAYKEQLVAEPAKFTATAASTKKYEGISARWEPTDKSKTFSDVIGRYVEAVDALYEAGVIKGTSETRFGVNDKLTRGQLMLLLYRLYTTSIKY